MESIYDKVLLLWRSFDIKTPSDFDCYLDSFRILFAYNSGRIENEGKDILKPGAYLHARFEYIHPFADGNGRVGRTLLNYFLMINGHPPVIIYDEDKRLYYETLEKYDAEEELLPLYEFLKYETEKTWQRTLERQKLERYGGAENEG